MPPSRRNLRRRVGPSRGNHVRPARISPPQFFKLMLPSTILERKLLLPEEFTTEFGDELSTVATLTVPSGCTWRVGIKKSYNDKMIWFCDGWQEFVEYYCIDFGYSLVFRYEGNSNFHVMIFNNVSGYQIEYPSDDQSSDVELNYNKQNEDDTDDSDESIEILGDKPFISHIGSSKRTHNCFSKRTIGRPSFGSPGLRNSSEKTGIQRSKLDHSNQSEMGKVNRLSRGRQKTNEMSCRRNISLKDEEGEDFLAPRSVCHKKKRRLVKQEAKNKALQAARKHKLENPSFMVIIKSHLNNYVYVPADFSRKYLRSCSKHITLEAPNGEEFLVSIYHDKASDFKRITQGWGQFINDNDLEEGDVCVFEAIHNKIGVLKVWMYHVADYGGS